MGVVNKAKAIAYGEVDLPGWVMTGLLTGAVILVCTLGGCASMRQATVTDTGQMLDSNGNKFYPAINETVPEEENPFEQGK